LQLLAAAADVEWNQVIENALADQLIMNWDHIRALAKAGMDVESHSRSHRVLETVPHDELVSELAGSKSVLEEKLGKAVRAIAYPVGRRIVGNNTVLTAVKQAGYEIGFTNGSGVNLTAGSASMLNADNRYDVRRLATDRAMSDAMLLAQMVVPPLAYIAKINR
jgi:peptidoglycan/xylan/chitin deacetylase (PgdA/CDA1 family)